MIATFSIHVTDYAEVEAEIEIPADIPLDQVSNYIVENTDEIEYDWNSARHYSTEPDMSSAGSIQIEIELEQK